jgi:glycosyltransferase involved in cell wall biosynthesis
VVRFPHCPPSDKAKLNSSAFGGMDGTTGSFVTVSVVISLYNKAPYIGATLESVLAQSYEDFEIVVVDDGSTDNGVDIVRGYTDQRISLHEQSNGGVWAACNTGLKLAKNEFVASLDSDDIWRPRHLEHLLILAKKFPEAVLYGNRFIPNGQIDVFDGEVHYELIDDYFARWVNADRTLFHNSSLMYRRKMVLDQGGFNAGRGHDFEFFVRMALRGNVAMSSYVGCFFIRRPNSVTQKPSLTPESNICLTAIRDFLDRPGFVPDSKRASLQEFRNKFAIGIATQCVKAGYKKEALTFLNIARGTRLQRKLWWQTRLLAMCPTHLRKLALSVRRRITALFLRSP